MNIKAKLLFRGETRELLQTDVIYNQLVQENGKPTSALLGGVITVHFQSQMYDDTFIETMFEHRFDKENNLRHSQKLYKVYDGKITFYKEEDDVITELFQYNFKDATIIDYQEEFNNQFGMYVTLTISPAMQDYRFFEGNTTWFEKSPTRYMKPWKESYIPPRKGNTNSKNDKTPKVIDWYLADMNFQKVEKGIIGDWIYLIIKTQNLKGKKITVNLNDSEVDYLLNGKDRLKSDVLKDYSILKDEEHVKLKVVEQLNKKENGNN